MAQPIGLHAAREQECTEGEQVATQHPGKPAIVTQRSRDRWEGDRDDCGFQQDQELRGTRDQEGCPDRGR